MFPAQLTDGYRAFLDDRFIREQERFEDLAKSGQKPQVMIIGCCDSRVSPETIFNARPGEMFVARNVGALIPP
jgi:carbonic anhydrase